MSQVIDTVGLKGALKITLTDTSGNVKDEKNVNNLVVDSGLDFIISRMTGTAESIMSHMAIGSGSTAAAGGDTTLGSELERVAITSDDTSNNTITYTATFAGGIGTGAVTESGLFNDPTAGTMLCRTVFGVVNKGVDDIMTINWTITLNAA